MSFALVLSLVVIFRPLDVGNSKCGALGGTKEHFLIKHPVFLIPVKNKLVIYALKLDIFGRRGCVLITNNKR